MLLMTLEIMNNYDNAINELLLAEDWKSAVAGGLLGLGALTGGTPDVEAGEPTAQVSTNQRETKGIRNNNPGNIEVGGDKWYGAVSDDGRFLIFKGALHGIRAVAKLIRTYEAKYNLNTIEGIITRWAPPKENDTESYIKSVAQKTGIKRDAKLNINNDTTMMKLVNAIIAHENANYRYNQSVVKGAVDLAKKDL